MASEIDRFVLKIDADFKALEEKLDKAISTMKKKKKEMEGAAAGQGLGGALEKGFENLADRMGEAAKAIPGFGAALGALGPIGATAAVGIGSFAIAMEQTEKALEYASNIEKLGKAIGVSTNFVQEFNFAAKQSDVDVGAADAALQNLNTSLGAVQANLPRARQLAVTFGDALGLKPEQLRGYKDVGELLPVIADRIRAAGSEAEKAAIARKLGIEELLPLLKGGSEGIAALTAQAHALGVVMDEAMIQKGAEAEQKLRELEARMQAMKNSTFVEYADTLIAIKTAFLEAETAALRFLAAITGTLPVAEKLADAQKDLIATRARRARFGMGENDPGVQAAQIKVTNLETELAQKEYQDKKKADEEMARRAGQGAAPQLVPTAPPKAKKTATPKDETLEFNKAALDAYEASLRDLANVQADLTSSIETRVAFEKDAIDADTRKKLADLTNEEAKIAAAAIDTNAQAQLEQIEAAKVNLQRIAVAKKLLIDERALAEMFDQQLAHEQAVANLQAGAFAAQAEHLNALAALASTTAERNKLENAALDAQQTADKAAVDATVERAKKELAWAEQFDVKNVQQAKDALAAAIQDQAIKGQRAADVKAQADRSHENPIQQYQRSLEDLNKTMMEAGVQASKSLADGLADAIVNAKNLGDVAQNVFRQLVQQVLSAVIEKSVTAPLLRTIMGGFAEGTLSSPAGWAMVGERGPELVRLPGGSQVIPNGTLRSAGMGRATPTGATIVFDNRGAVIWEQAARQMMSYADRAAAQAGVGAVQTSRRATPTDLARSSARRLG